MRSKRSIFLILTLSLIIPSLVYSAVVTQTTAEQVAMNWYSERNDKAPNDFEIVESFIETENADNVYYIFNFDKTGFVIVSADDIAVPILGYVFKHNYTTENHPPQFDAMLASYREQILYARENDLPPPQETVDKWNRLKVTTDMFVPENVRAVGPLLSTTWNQGQFYNESCPADAGSLPSDPGTPGNGYVWAGCTATATAQVMKYHAHPATGEGIHSYTDATYGPQSANFGATTYNWAAMPNNVTVVTPSVHTLIYHVGVGAEMGYGLYGSGAWIGGAVPASALSALQNHFKYDTNSYYDQRNNYSATPLVWHAMLKTELDNNRPLVYEGYNSGYSDGHAFVLDGYQGVANDNYHVNWGWSGSYDGYYTLDALAPVLPNYDYRFYQGALFGVEPRKWRPLPDVSIDVSLLPYTGVDLDNYYEGPTSSLNYSVVTDLTGQEFALAINGNNELYFTANPSITSNVNIDITIRATYTGGIADDTFNFIITGASTDYDWGDAPDPTYPTFAASTGAYHQIVAGVQLGNTIDSEQDGQPDPNATGDDNDGNNDDDGVVFNSSLIPGSIATVTVTASVPGILDAWLDFDGNGFWVDPGEQIFMNHSLTAGPNNLSFTVPASSIIGTTYSRFRFNTVGVLGMTGSASNGEVEDYEVEIGEESSIKWEQLPDLTENGMDVSCSNNPDSHPPVVLADDFECITTGPITDIHVWGSWWNDMQPEDMGTVIFRLSIHDDIPAGVQEPWSMPGDVLWTRDFLFGEYDSELYNVGQEWWFDPVQMFFTPAGDTECWLYNFYIDPLEAFIQEGTPDEPVIYWLEVQAIFNDPFGVMFGWKTSVEHWNDDAVWGQGVAPFMGPWNELRYPPTHPYEDESIDLAFAITTTPEEPEEYDFGDAPEGDNKLAYPSGVTGSFPTCVTVGPSGYIQHGFGENWAWFGDMVDLETDGNAGLCPGCFPTYDDDECFNDGDAGLLFPDSYTIDATGSVTTCPSSTAGSSLGIICQLAVWGVDIDIDVTNTMPVDGYVNVLVDWNQNGQWQNDPLTQCAGVVTPEHVLVDFGVPSGHIGSLSSLMAIGSSFQIGPNIDYVWVRFSITEAPVGIDWDGSGVFEDGETEDYLLYVGDEEPEELDFGDAPDDTTGTLYPTLVVNDGARHILDGVTFLGASVDSEPDGQPDASATGDDNDGNDDEDGVLPVSPLIPGEQGAVYVQASVSGFLNAWLDFDGNGSWDATDQIFTDELLIPGWNPLNFPVPITAVPGNTFARFRFDTGGGLGVTGQADDGEVEDYRVLIEEDLHDGLKMHYHQWPDTTSFGVDVCVIEEIDLPRRIVADDFLCVESGPINSIHIWGSWKYDEVMFDNLIFDLAIWSDNPNGPSGWSEPDMLLWEKQFVPGEYNEFPYYDTANGECWYDPCTGEFLSPGDYTIWEYDFLIPDADAFMQEAGTVYWLSVKAHLIEPGFQFGWKSSVNHWNDDAVYQCNYPTDPWIEMIYPAGHPFNPQGEEHVSMDMAFYIDCDPQDPQNITISKVGTNMTLQWDASWCAAYYNVYSSTDPYAPFPGGWTLEATGITTTTWNDPVSTAGSKKFYRVTAEN